MTKEIHVGIVAEGTTDHTLLNEIICSILDKDNDCLPLQPTLSSTTPGWYGVIDFCLKKIKKIGYEKFLLQDISRPIDVLIIALDGDQHNEPLLDCAARDRVYCQRYQDVTICYTFRTTGTKKGLAKCSFYPPEERLQAIPIENRVQVMQNWVLRWCGLQIQPDSLVITIPCCMIESWIVAALDGAEIDGICVEEIDHIFED